MKHFLLITLFIFFIQFIVAIDEIIAFPCNIERIILTENDIIPTLPNSDRPLIYVRYIQNFIYLLLFITYFYCLSNERNNHLRLYAQREFLLLNYGKNTSVKLTSSNSYSQGFQEVTTHSLTHLLTHSLTHSLTYSLTHLLTHSLTHSLTYSLTHLLTHSPVTTRRLYNESCGYNYCITT